MKKHLFIQCLVFTLSFSSNAQDTLYARQVIKKLTSKEFFGRGYINNGLDAAAKYISSELTKNKAQAIFATGYFQWFDFNVNTFPGKMTVKINGKLLKPGEDYIVSPESTGAKGKFNLTKKDSVTYLAQNSSPQVAVEIKKKLTFSVATQTAAYCLIEILDNGKISDYKTVEANIENKLLTKYINKNVCAFIPGKENNDSLIVFTAHYDHLGGMGKTTYFPGANDNASGVSMLLNLVNYYTKNPPKYKTVFLFFAGEEAGLLGSKYFTEKNDFDFRSVKF
jgi:aminopeptidase YwaD